MPQVDDEDKSRRVAVVPHFVLERVVKHNELALAPRPAKHTHIPIKCTSTTAISESRSCANLVSSATRMRGPSGTTRPRCARRRQLVGPQCGHTCTPGCITENLICKARQRAVIDPKSSGLLHSWSRTWPRRHPIASGIFDTSSQVFGVLRQFFASFRPETEKENTVFVNALHILQVHLIICVGTNLAGRA